MRKLLFTLAFVGGIAVSSQAKEDIYTYVITETAMPTSFDPLDADQTQNLPVMRMLHATPIELDTQDNISSMILESYKYDASKKTIEWSLKEDAKYSDGTKITADDVAFSVARMAYTRPKFPVLEHIEGLTEWAQKPNALESFPKGIKVKGKKVSIKLIENVKHPLFRFTLEIFSVIPKKCVDLKTNKVSCEKLPTSGRYELVEKDSSEILFKKRDSISEKTPSAIKFKYLPATESIHAMESFDSKTIMAGNEIMFSAENLSEFRKNGNLAFLPAARFAILHLNSGYGVFKRKACRQTFASAFRRNFKAVTKEQSLSEDSIFTSIVIGYLSKEELSGVEIMSADQISDCKKQIAESEITWGYVETEKNSNFAATMTATLQEFGVKKIDPILFKNRKDLTDAFMENKLSLTSAGSGFWALDPSGDLQMLFTPNLHKTLNSVTSDPKLQTLIKGVKDNPESKEAYFAVNKYLYGNAQINIYSHVRRFYFAKNKEILSRTQFGFSAPTPWQVFQQ